MSSNQPLVSIITPSLNQAAFIEAAIESVLAQDYPQIEYLVVDGGSSDGTLDILRSYGPRIRWISESDAGQSDAIDKGVRLTRGQVLAWLNADDIYLPGAVSRAVAAFAEDADRALVYGEAQDIDMHGHVVGPSRQIEPWSMRRLLEFGDFIVQPAAFFLRSAYDAVGGLDRSLHYCMDYDLWIKLGQRYTVRYLDEPLAQTRIYDSTKTSSGGLKRLIEIEAMVRRYGRTRLPACYYPEIVRACGAALRHGLRNGLSGGEARALLRRGAMYGLVYAARRIRYGHTWQH
jgi:cellulose synthase/poly-beta-1,6-N-acetylglucosamine synthase-like glycosyltransferase